MSEQSSSTSAVVRGVRRAAIITIVGSLVIAAALGIIALLSGEFGELQGRVLLTTLTVAAFGTTALCHLATISREVRVVGFIGIAASVIAAVCALVLIWGNLHWEDTDGLWKGLALGSIAAVSLAQANLLLLLSGRNHQVIRITLWATLAAVAVVAIMIALPILTDGEIPGDRGDGYWRVFGVVAIIDALGTIALPILALVLRGTETAQPASPDAIVVRVPHALADRLRVVAHRDGVEVEEAALAILAAGLDGVSQHAAP